LLTDAESNETVAQYIRERIAERVHDAETARRLTPTGYTYGARRALMETGYYEAFNRDNVDLVDLRETPINAITADDVRVSDGRLPL
jgi:cation diffusion facilitator CzcD-associated flavoprotein CzcO